MTTLNPTDIQAILLSAKVATVATILSLPFGFFCAYALCFHEFKGKMVLEGIINLPLTLPPVVIGYLLLLLLGSNGWLAPLFKVLGIRLIFTWKAAVISSAVV